MINEAAAPSSETRRPFPSLTRMPPPPPVVDISTLPIVVARGLRRTYAAPDGSAIHALDNVDLDIYRGELTVIAGPSGSGKSTLLQALAGLDRPDSEIGRASCRERV